MGCTAETLGKVDAGVWVLDADAGAACLSALTISTCSAQDVIAVSTLCYVSEWVHGTEPLGKGCDSLLDCAQIDAGPNFVIGLPVICQVGYEALACEGVCTLGAEAGQSCGPEFVFSQCAIGQGCCMPRTDSDGGEDLVCVPFSPDGGACSVGGMGPNCDPLFEYCDDPFGPSPACRPYLPLGGACETTECGDVGACSCLPSDGATCITIEDGGGVCSPTPPSSCPVWAPDCLTAGGLGQPCGSGCIVGSCGSLDGGATICLGDSEVGDPCSPGDCAAFLYWVQIEPSHAASDAPAGPVAPECLMTSGRGAGDFDWRRGRLPVSVAPAFSRS